MKAKIILISLLGFLLIFNSCKKEAGVGGNSSIRGKVYAKYYNKNFSVLADSGYAPNIDVYIIYGDNIAYGDHQKTTYDGAFEFKYLQKGQYKVYAFSKDSTGAASNHVNQYAPRIGIVKETTITKNKQQIELPEIHIIQ
jgi:hypothetical protein